MRPVFKDERDGPSLRLQDKYLELGLIEIATPAPTQYICEQRAHYYKYSKQVLEGHKRYSCDLSW